MARRFRLAALLLVFVLLTGSVQACASGGKKQQEGTKTSEKTGSYYETIELDEDASYDTKDEVCAYLIRFHRLPSNYMTRKEARSEGWEGGALHKVVPGKCIGGDVFGNYEGLLPEKDGRQYHECDIDTLESSGRGAKRIVYSGEEENEEWNIYYTDDHYETFTLLWGSDKES